MLTDPASAAEGSLHYDTDANKLYVKQSSGFFLLATITNTTPTITSFSEATGGASANNLTTGGPFGLTAGSNTVITINATDPDLETLVYSATVTSGTASDVISSPSLPISNQSGNTFTLVPASSGGGTITVRFDVSDGNNIANVTHSFSIAFTITDSNFTRLLMATDNAVGGNQSITDSSSTAHTITVNNDSHAGSFSPYKAGGYSTHFNGSTDYLTVADNAEHDFGTGEFSMEFFWKPETLTGNTSNLHIAISTGNDSSTQFIYHESNYWYFQGGSAGATIINSSGTGAATVGQWNHVVLCRTGTTLSIFHNGTRTATATSSYDTDFSNATIGRYYGSSADYYIDGLVRDMRWLKGSSAYDATQSSITVPTEALTAVTNTKLLLFHTPYIADGSSTGHTITLSGSTHTRPSSPYDTGEYSEASTGGSVSFDGVSDSLQFTASADLQALGRTGTAATIEAWVYLNSAPSSNGTAIYSLGTAGSTGGNNVLSFEIQNNRTLRGMVNGAYSNTTGCPISTGTVPLKIWTHIALVLNSGTWTIYLNGSADGTGTGSYPSGASHSTAYVGRVYYDDGRDADMVVSDLRVTSDAQYTTAFTPPTAPLTTVSNTKLHVKGTDAHVLDKSQVNNIKLTSAVSAADTPYSSGKSIYFNGNNHVADVPASDHLILGDSYTIEGWVKATSLSQSYNTMLAGNGNRYYWAIRSNGGLNFYDYNGGNNYDTVSGLITTNTWYYIAAVCTSGTLVLYSGTSSGNFAARYHGGGSSGSSGFAMTDTNTSNFNGGGTRFGESSGGNSQRFEGYLADWRFSKGKARTVTVPTSSLKG